MVEKPFFNNTNIKLLEALYEQVILFFLAHFNFCFLVVIDYIQCNHEISMLKP